METGNFNDLISGIIKSLNNNLQQNWLELTPRQIRFLLKCYFDLKYAPCTIILTLIYLRLSCLGSNEKILKNMPKNTFTLCRNVHSKGGETEF